VRRWCSSCRGPHPALWRTTSSTTSTVVPDGRPDTRTAQRGP
jgi:hypothetical protein